jgi:hypothetical protein
MKETQSFYVVISYFGETFTPKVTFFYEYSGCGSVILGQISKIKISDILPCIKKNTKWQILNYIFG